MSLFSLEVQSYRAFRDKTRVDFRPLTLLYGYNQAGKSTLLRLLPFLADSIYENQGPLAMNSPALPSPVFKELGWLGNEPSFSPEIKIVAGDPDNSNIALKFADENGVIVDTLRLANKGNEHFNVAWNETKKRSGGQLSANYEGRDRGTDFKGDLNFESFFPSGLPEQAAAIAQAVKQACASLERVQWLRANRIAGGGEIKPIRCCRPDGADLAQKIAQNVPNTILQSVSAWLETQDGLENEIIIDRKYQILIGSAGREPLPLYLAGEGVRSLLPLILCAAWAETNDARAPTMLAFEEPESHLHPHLQVALFDRLLETMKKGIPVVLETHSIYILRAMQLAVLEGRLSPQEIGLYWVNQAANGAANVEHVKVNEDATLQNWRPDVFEKEQELAQKIMALRWRQGSGS